MLYDEPTAGLDPEISSSINNLIRELRVTLGITSIVVTHLERCVRTVADRVLLLEGGSTVWEGSREDFENTDHPRLRSFLGGSSD